MKLTILGCDGSYPGANGACSGYHVSSPEGSLQLDLGCGTLPRLMALQNPEALAAICLTHWHNDHVGDMLALQYYLQIHKHSLRVLAPPEHHPLRGILSSREFTFLDISQATSIAGFAITALRVLHPLPAYALRLERKGAALVYTGDVAGGEGLVDFCRGADLLVCDATFTKAQWTPALPHFSAAQAAALAREAGVKQLILTHAQPGSDKGLLLREAREIFEKAIMAEPGLVLSL